MPAITTFIAVAGLAAAIGGTISQQKAASKQRKQAKKQAKEAQAAANAPDPTKQTGADVQLARRDIDTRRGRGSKAARNQSDALGLGAPSAAGVGGLT